MPGHLHSRSTQHYLRSQNVRYVKSRIRSNLVSQNAHVQSNKENARYRGGNQMLVMATLAGSFLIFQMLYINYSRQGVERNVGI